MVYAVTPRGNDERRREALEATGAAVRTAGCRLAAKRNAIAEKLAALGRYITHGHRSMPKQAAALICCPGVSMAKKI